MTEARLLAEFEALIADAHLIDAFAAAALHKHIGKFAVGQGVADAIINRWLEAFHAQPAEPDAAERLDELTSWGGPLHADIKAAFEAVKEEAEDGRSLFDLVSSMVERNDWGQREEIALNASTPEQFHATIKSRSGSDLKVFIIKCMDLCGDRQEVSPVGRHAPLRVSPSWPRAGQPLDNPF